MRKDKKGVLKNEKRRSSPREENVISHGNEVHPLIQFDAISVRGSGQAVLKDLSLSVMQGHVMGVVGPDGAGKSTLLRVLAGLVRPKRGLVTVDGVRVGAKTREWVSYLPAHPLALPSESCRDLRRLYRAFYKDFDDFAFDRACDRLNIPSKQPFSQMSEGLQQCVMVALCLSRRARVYALDDPLRAVDPMHRKRIIEMLIDAAQEDRTFLIATNDLEALERLFDAVCFLQKGKICKQGFTDALRIEEGCMMQALYERLYG